jgi:glutamine amidotransferase
MIAIVDYGLGNLRSIEKAFCRIGRPAVISSSERDILDADRLVLPGVGHFKQGMANLRERGLDVLLREAVIERGKPILGICLGMQLLTEFSAEGECDGLGWVPARVTKFSFAEGSRRKVPHMGWNTVRVAKPHLELFQGTGPDSEFYFVHSFYVAAPKADFPHALTAYGDEFISCFQSGRIHGVQFHPEKSHEAGLAVLKNFAGGS